MLRVILFLALCLLAGCASTMPQQLVKLPPPAQLMVPADKLQPINDGATLNNALPVIVSNYESCKRNADRLSSLQEWARQ